MIFNLWGEKRRRTVTPGDKSYLIRIARGKCEYCGCEIIGKGIIPEIHHIVPHASGGSDREHNLIVLCPNCHTKVDQMSRAELRMKIAYRLPKKVSAQTNIAKKNTTKKTTPKKAATKKPSVKKATTKKTTAKKAASKKVNTKNIAAKEATPKKTSAKRPTTKRVSAKKTTAKKTATKSRTAKKK
jgi:5-methylcytosine-specific restriction endonuclease McrA